MVWDGDGFRKMLDHLDWVRSTMVGPKNTKLLMRWEQHGEYRQWPLDNIIEAVIKEMDELAEALAIKSPSDIREEVVDVANVLDFLWDKLKLERA
jgi:hypothetical protein